MKKYILASNGLFLIKLIGSTQLYAFNHMKTGTLAEVIRHNNQHGIEFIKMYNPVANNFKKLNRKHVELHFSWDTESYEELKKVNYVVE